MFAGTTIDELISSVERAEKHAQRDKSGTELQPNVWTYNMDCREMSEVA